MSQHDLVVDNAQGLAFRADVNNALMALVTQSSGPSAPTSTYAFQFWADTTAAKLKIRNAANDNWVIVGDLGVVNLGLQAADVNLVMKNVANLFTKPQRPHYLNTDTVSATGTYTYDGNTKGQINLITMTNAITVTFGAPTNIVEGQPYTFLLKAGDTAARVYAWNAAYENAPPTAGTLVNGKKDIIHFIGGPSNTLIYSGSTVGV